MLKAQANRRPDQPATDRKRRVRKYDRTSQMSVWFGPGSAWAKAELQRCAEAENRSESNMAVSLIMEGLKARKERENQRSQ